MFTLIENGEVYAPEPMGRNSVLLADTSILKIGEVDARALAQLDLPVEVIDATDCFVTPGLIDPHQHLLGGSGEEGFSSQTPEISANENNFKRDNDCCRLSWSRHNDEDNGGSACES
jgi:beta-aspartyl-dipeptidase (metallo-type)